MAISLAQAKLSTQDKVAQGVIDEFRKSSFIMDNILFDDTVSPSGGNTLTYGYSRVTTQPTAGFRAINADYTAQEAQTTRYNVDLKVFGGSFQVDRVFKNLGGLYNLVDFQVAQKVKATNAVFNDTLINGDSATDAAAFDGINKAVTGTSTEYGGTAVIDLSTAAALDSNYKAFMDALDEYLSNLDGKPSFLGGNNKLITKIKAVARRAGYLTQSEDAFGKKVDAYDGIVLVDLGDKPGSTSPVSPIVSRTVGTAQTGLTDLYAVRLGIDGVHAASLAGQNLVQVYLPDFARNEAVQGGSVEMVAALAVKATKSAGVFRNIKVQ